jgi:GWxTD domain-containing protein
MIRFRGAVVAVFAILFAGSVFAALSPKYADWAKGPEQWLMTRDDWKAWRNVKTDEEAQQFIDLFWVRRDPTVGTYRNEFKEEFEGRVAYADANYKSEHGKRGSLTEPGRVFILLGAPHSAGGGARQSMMMMGGSESAPVSAPAPSSGARGINGIGDTGNKMNGQLGATMVWEYDRPGDLGLTGPAYFIEDITSHDFHYDPQRSNVGGALTTAIGRAIKNPQLTAVPDWAVPPKLEYKQLEYKQIEPNEVEAKVTVAPASGTTVIKQGGKVVETVVQPAGAPGAHDLTLIADSRAIKPQADADPFAGVVHKSSFTKNDDIAFMFQYCRPAVDAVRTKLKFAILLSGKVGGEDVDIEVPEDETTAEPVKTMPGCSIVRGAIPASSLQPGSYSFTIRVTDPATSQSYNLAQDFKVE